MSFENLLKTTCAKVAGGNCKFTVLTVNCWGLKYFSKDRAVRIAALGEALTSLELSLDAVLCQELWCKSDYETLRRLLEPRLPYAHRFHGGCVGSGLAVFSAHAIQATTFVPFQPNGKYWKVHHADWYAAKGVAVARVRFCEQDVERTVNLMTTHTHVEKPGGEYRAHRIAQAVALADLFDCVCEAADVTILAGDFNSRPTEDLMALLLGVTDLQDAWATSATTCSHPTVHEEAQTEKQAEKQAEKGKKTKKTKKADSSTSRAPRRRLSRTGIPIDRATVPGSRERGGEFLNDKLGGFTCDLACNSYGGDGKRQGSRLDYILYRGSRYVTAKAVCCARPLPSRIPSKWGRDCSFSDHEALVATFEFIQTPQPKHLARGTTAVTQVAADAMRIAGTELRRKLREREAAWRWSLAFAVLALAAVLATLWLPPQCARRAYVTVPVNFARTFLGVAVFVLGFVHPVATHAEINSLRRAWSSLVLRTRGDATLLSASYLD